MSDPRIVSLLPSATEIVAALGFRDRLVGRSHECDFPSGVEQLPACSSSKVAATGSSGEIDRQVKELVAEGLSVYRVDADLLHDLQPDVILTQTQCAVCAVTPRDLEDAVCRWVGAAPTIVSLEPNNLDDAWHDIARVGKVLGVQSKADAVVASLRERLDSLRARSSGIRERPTVAALEWLNPLMAGGNWMPDLIEIGGGRSLLARPNEHSAWLEWDDLVTADPEVILLVPCGFRIAQTISDLHLLQENRSWKQLRAVRDGRVFLVDGHHFFNRPGPRLVESAEIVAEILYPEHFQFGHHGNGWVALSEV